MLGPSRFSWLKKTTGQISFLSSSNVLGKIGFIDSCVSTKIILVFDNTYNTSFNRAMGFTKEYTKMLSIYLRKSRSKNFHYLQYGTWMKQGFQLDRVSYQKCCHGKETPGWCSNICWARIIGNSYQLHECNRLLADFPNGIIKILNSCRMLLLDQTRLAKSFQHFLRFTKPTKGEPFLYN